MNDEKWFGSIYDGSVGDTSKDLILKTKGKIKILILKKFIDLLKNGKLNIDVDFFNEVDSLDDIDGEGCYLYNGNVYVKIGDNLILISDGSDSTYVSFVVKQDTTEEQKKTAQNNIGLTFDTIEEAIEALSQGFVFIGDKIYYIDNNTAEPFEYKFPNPFPEQLVIDRKDNAPGGALVLKGISKLNGLDINNNQIYSDENSVLILNSPNKISLTIDNYEILLISDAMVKSIRPVISSEFASFNFKLGQTGFRLIDKNGYSILEVDKVIERDPSDSSTIFDPVEYSGNVCTLSLVIPTILESRVGDGYKTTITDLLYIPSSTLKTNDVAIVNIKAYPALLQDGKIIPEEKTITYIDSNNLLQSYKVATSDVITLEFLLKEDGKLYPLENGEIKPIEMTEGKLEDDKYEVIKIGNKYYYFIDSFADAFKNRFMFVKADGTKKFMINYRENKIALQDNSVVNNKVKEVNHTVLGDISAQDELHPGYKTYNDRNDYKLGIYTDNLVVNGAEFRGEVTSETNPTEANTNIDKPFNYARYSTKLGDKFLEIVQNPSYNNEFDNVIPPYKAIKLNDPLKSINWLKTNNVVTGLGLPKSTNYNLWNYWNKNQSKTYPNGFKGENSVIVTKSVSTDANGNPIVVWEYKQYLVEPLSSINNLDLGAPTDDNIILKWNNATSAKKWEYYLLREPILSINNSTVLDGKNPTKDKLILRWHLNESGTEKYWEYVDHIVLNSPLTEINSSELAKQISEGYILMSKGGDNGLWKYFDLQGWITDMETCCRDVKRRISALEDSNRKFTVSWYDYRNGTLITTTQVKNGDSAVPPSTPSRKGYNFICWSLNEYNCYNSESITEDTTIYGTWEKIIPKLYISCSPSIIDNIGGTVIVSYYAELDGEIITEGITVTGTYKDIEFEQTGEAYIENNKVNVILEISESSYVSLGKITFTASYPNAISVSTTLQLRPAGSISLPEFDLMKFSMKWTNTIDYIPENSFLYDNPNWKWENDKLYERENEESSWEESTRTEAWKYNSDSKYEYFSRNDSTSSWFSRKGDLDTYTYLSGTNIPIIGNKTLDKMGTGFGGDKKINGLLGALETINRDNTDIIVRKNETKIFTSLKEINEETIEEYNINHNENVDKGKDVFRMYQYIAWSGDNSRSGGEYNVINFSKVINNIVRTNLKAIFIYIKAGWFGWNGHGHFDLIYNIYKLNDENKGLESPRGQYDFNSEDSSIEMLNVSSNELLDLYNVRGSSYPKKDTQLPVATLYYDLMTHDITFLKGYYTEEDIYGSSSGSGTFQWDYFPETSTE